MASIPVTFIGVMTYTDVGVGGGPMPGGPQPSHPIAPGGPPPQIWPSPGHPSHPIAPGGPPPGIWGGAPPYVDIGGPPPQPGIWPNPPEGQAPIPSHPIVLPPNLPPTLPDPDNRPVNWKTAWTPVTGWVFVGIPSGTHPPPSAPAPTPS